MYASIYGYRQLQIQYKINFCVLLITSCTMEINAVTTTQFKFLAMVLVLKTSFNSLPTEICLSMVFFLLIFSRPSTCAVHPSLMG